MDGRVRSIVVAGLGLAVATTLCACAGAGDLEFSNAGPDEVTVSTGDDEFTISPDGGVVLLGHGCTAGDVTVEFASGRTVVVPGPVCPDERVVVGDGDVEVRRVASRG